MSSVPHPATAAARQPEKVATWSTLEERIPTYALVANVDLVIVRDGDQVSVLFGRCLHRGALLSDGYIDGPNLICGLHHWDYRFDTGISSYNPDERLTKFTAWVDVAQDAVFVDRGEVQAFNNDQPQPFKRSEYLGLYEDTHGTSAEPYNKEIRYRAAHGLSSHHGDVSAMGVPLTELPRWSDLQVLTAQLWRRPMMDDEPVDTEVVLGPNAQKPLRFAIPLIVSDMSFGAISEEAKLALSQGAELSGTGICSGEGGMLPEEQASNQRYLYEMASGMFGFSIDKVKLTQAFHFKAGQGAKTGTGGHLPGEKVIGRIAEVRGLKEGTPAVSPPTFPDLKTVEDYRRFGEDIRAATGGIPVGFKMSAQHIERDIDFALDAGADYIILDGRGGGTGAAPNVFKENISVPTIPALARARRHLDRQRASGVSLVITGGLRTEGDFIKALALGADAIAVSNSALQAIGCLGMRACHTNNCPVGIATQKPNLRSRLIVEQSAERLHRYFTATVDLMKVLSRACGHRRLSDFCIDDLSTWNRELATLTGVRYAGVDAAPREA